MGNITRSTVNAQKKRVLVVAGRMSQYVVYCRENGLNPAQDAIFAQAEHVIAGLHGLPIVRTGTWWENPLANHRRIKDRETLE